MELQVEASHRVQDGTQDQPITNMHGSRSNNDDPQEKTEERVKYCNW
jgi:hypothetical protein